LRADEEGPGHPTTVRAEEDGLAPAGRTIQPSRSQHANPAHHHDQQPRDQVFAYLTDPDKLASWQPSTVEVRRSKEGPLAVGERFQEVHSAMGHKLESALEVIEYRPPACSSFTSSRARCRWTVAGSFESKNGSTPHPFTGEGELGGR
jgi:hypothetical protein